MKAKKCTLIFHGACKEIPMGEFKSKATAKQYVRDCDWKRPYTIKPIKK